MKLVTIIILVTPVLFEISNINSTSMSYMSATETCFSPANFEHVYKYVDIQIKKNNANFYTYGNYDLYLSNEMEISFKKNKYTLSKVIREKGIFSLVKSKRDHDKALKEANHVFCELLLTAHKYLNQ